MSVPVFRPTIRRRDMDAVLTCLVNDNIGPGALSHQLASDFTSYLGVDSAVCVRDYATAINLVLDSIGAVPGDQVILSPLAPAVYKSVLSRRGIGARLVDVDGASGALPVEAVSAVISSDVRAIIVHYTNGIIPDIAALAQLEIPLIEDISEGFGGITADKRVGTYGKYAIVGMEAGHIVTAGGGAAVLASGKREKADLKRATDQLPVEMILSDMNAALGNQQLKRIEQFIEKRREIAAVYSRAIARGRHRTLVQPGEVDNVYYSFAVVLANGAKEVIHYARKKQVEVVRAFESSFLAASLAASDDILTSREISASNSADGGLTETTATLEHVNNASANGAVVDAVTVEAAPAGEFPNAYSLYLRCVLFPLYPSLPKKDVERIEKVLTTLP